MWRFILALNTPSIKPAENPPPDTKEYKDLLENNFVNWPTESLWIS